MYCDVQISSPSTSRICSAILVPTLIRRDAHKIKKIHRRATKLIPEIRNHSYHQRIQKLDLISLVQIRMPVQLIEVLAISHNCQCKMAYRLWPQWLNNFRNNGAKLILKDFNVSVVQNFHPIKISSTYNDKPNEVGSSRTVNSFKRRLIKHCRGRKSLRCPS